MDWQKLFLSAYGRSKRQDFWIGWLILVGAQVVLGFIPLIGLVANLGGIYVRVCLYSKRLHDMGKSGWWQVVPWAVNLLAIIVGFAIFGTGIIAAAMKYNQSSQSNDPAAVFALLSSMGGLLAIFGLVSLFSIAFLVWVGAVEGQKGENQYGPDPLSPAETDVF